MMPRIITMSARALTAAFCTSPAVISLPRKTVTIAGVAGDAIDDTSLCCLSTADICNMASNVFYALPAS